MRATLLVSIAVLTVNCSGESTTGTDALQDILAQDSMTVEAVSDVTTDGPLPDTGETADTGTDGPNGGDAIKDQVEAEVVTEYQVYPNSEFTGSILIREDYDSDGELATSDVVVRLRDSAAPPTEMLLDEQGACQYYLASLSPACDPLCPPDQFCASEDECRPWPQRVSAGVITFSGLSVEAQATPDETAWYSVTGVEAGPDLFDSNSQITVSAEGADIPAFEVQMEGVGEMVTDFGDGLTLEDGSPAVVSWDVLGDGATIELGINTGWHGAPPAAIIWCTFPESAGSIVIPQALVEAFPPAGGMGLFPWPSFVRRVKRKVVKTPYGPVEVTAVSEKSFQAIHNPW